MTSFQCDTSIWEVYFFGPKSTLFLLKYAKLYLFVVVEDLTTIFSVFDIFRKIIANNCNKQAGAELCQAQGLAKLTASFNLLVAIYFNMKDSEWLIY